MSRILVTGMSGTGKSSALAELGRHGYRVVDTDDPGWREYREDPESSDEVHRGEWLWVEERISELLDSDDGRSLFVQGCVRDQSKFHDRFSAVVLLSAPADVILDRVERRTTNPYGKTPVERAMILADLARVEPLLRASCTHELDASRPLDEVVADLIAIAERPGHALVGLGRPLPIGENGAVAVQRMDNVGIVVESLDAAISFFAQLGLELEGRAIIEGDWSGRVTGLRDQRVEIAMMRTPDGHGKIELSRFLTPPPAADHRNAPVNALGYLRVMFAVDDLDETLARLRQHGAQLVDEVVQYEDVTRLCYVRGPEGILIGRAEQVS